MSHDEKMKQAGLRDMFRYRATASVEPLENFTTAALAVAIHHEPRPFLNMLAGLSDWKAVGDGSLSPGRLQVDPAEVSRVETATQVRLEARDGTDLGIVDLVLTLITDDGARQAVWIEVKVDAPLGSRIVHTEDGEELSDQLVTYMRHRSRMPDSPFLLSLTRDDKLRPDVPVINWRDVDREAATVPGQGHWSDLRVFLEEARIVPPPLPPGLGSWEQYTAIFKEVNGNLRKMWPDVPGGMGASPPWTTRLLRLNVRDQARIYQTAHCLSYGIRMSDTGAEWWVAVGDGSVFHGTRVPVEEVVEAAERAFARGQLQGWQILEDVYRADRFDVLEKTRPNDGASASDVVAWLTEAFAEVKASRVIEPYLRQRRHRGS